MRKDAEAARYWDRIRAAFRYRCAYCGEKPAILDREHMVPRSRGGDDTIENIVPSCRSCNTGKGFLTPLEWFLCEAGHFRRTSPERGHVEIAPAPPAPIGRRVRFSMRGEAYYADVIGETATCYRVRAFAPIRINWSRILLPGQTGLVSKEAVSVDAAFDPEWWRGVSCDGCHDKHGYGYVTIGLQKFILCNDCLTGLAGQCHDNMHPAKQGAA